MPVAFPDSIGIDFFKKGHPKGCPFYQIVHAFNLLNSRTYLPAFFWGFSIFACFPLPFLDFLAISWSPKK